MKTIIVNWKENFSADTIAGAKKILEQNSILYSKIKSTYYFSTVMEKRKAHYVRIDLRDKNITSACDCGINNCVHIAATLMKMEEDGIIHCPPEESATDNPFKGFLNGTTESYYFDMEKMTKKMKFIDSDVLKAHDYIKNKKILITGYEFSNTRSSIRFQAVNYPNKEISIYLIHNTISEIYCTISEEEYYRYYFNEWRGASFSSPYVPPYTIAALILLGDTIKEINPCDETDSNAHSLLGFLMDNDKLTIPDNSEDIVKEKQTIHFEPFLEFNDNYVFAGFKIGSKKLYVVKNLSAIITAYDCKQPYELGKNSTLNFANDVFDEESKKLFDYVRDISLEEEADRKFNDDRNHYDDYDYGIKSRLPLYGKKLDDFFEILNGKEIQCKNQETETVKFTDGNPKPKLVVTAEKDSRKHLSSVNVDGTIFDIYNGANFNYCYDKGSFVRFKNFSNKSMEFLAAHKNYDNTVHFSFGNKYISEFVNHILPWLKEFTTVDDSSLSDIEDKFPAKGKINYYFDLDENDVITARVEAVYEEKKFDPADLIFKKNLNEERDHLLENKAVNLLTSFFRINSYNDTFSIDTDDEMYNFLENGLPLFQEIGTVNLSESFNHLKLRKAAKVSVGVKLESNLLNLEVTSDEITQKELLEILEGMKKKKRYVRLKNGDFINTQNESLEELEELFDTLKLSPKDFVKGKISLPAYRALYLDKMLESTQGLYLNRDSHFKNLVKEFKTVDDSEFEAPESLQSIMRNYQMFGHKWMRTLSSYNFAGILADDMGLGKTLQTISVLLSAKENNTAGTSLVVTPASLVFNWKNEINKFAPNLTAATVSGTQAERSKIIESYKDYDILITSYDLLKRDIAEYDGKEFLYEVIDEAQFIKNHTTAASKSVKVISAMHKMALTGTPIENRLSELWSIFDYLMPGYLFGYETFKKNFETPIVKNKDEKAGSQLKKMVSPFILRRLKSDVLKDLPEKIEEVRYAEFESEQSKLYEAQKIKISNMINKSDDDSFSKSKFQVLAELTKLRQICCDPSLLFENYEGESAKRNACIDLIQSGIEGEHKMLVFSQFTSMLELLEKDLNERGIKYYKIIGETDKKKRLDLVEQFNSDDTPVFLISLKAGGTGLNLTSADIVIHYDPWWNLAVQNQATDRAHRIGQKNIVSVFKLIAKNSIEEKIVELQNSKKNLADEILNGENGNIGSMSKEEILSLL